MTFLRRTAIFLVSISVLASAAAGGCQTRTVEQSGDAVALKILKFDESEDWGETTTLEFTATGMMFMISISPIAGDFDGWIKLDVQPGDAAQPGYLTGIHCDPPACSECGQSEVIGQNVRIDNAGRDLCVGVRLAFGEAHIIARDIGFVPADPVTAACSDGIDNDGDGLVDYGQDNGCAYLNDDTEEGGEYIVGVSPPLFFLNPRIENIQGYSSVSPLMGESVTINRGTIVVTRISTEGFYVSDIDPLRPDLGFNHLYTYNYNTPWELRECDVLQYVSGIVTEFYGYTELSFPSWKVIDPEGRVEVPQSADDCPIPEPTLLDSDMLADNAVMESLEAGLIQVRGGMISDRFENCDFNRDGRVEWEGPEADCADACDEDPGCTEMTQYNSYGQWAVNAGGSKVFVITHDAYPDFNPLNHRGKLLDLVRGTLRQVEFIDPPWILEIRCRDDLVEAGGEIKPMYRACVPKQPRGYLYDDN
ncbi:MAG: hypothetical protein ABIJ56_00745 [Pseudomonadota bacterium]